MTLAFLDVQSLMVRASEDGLIDLDENRYLQEFEEFSRIADFTLHGMKIAQHTARQSRSTAPEAAPSAV